MEGRVLDRMPEQDADYLEQIRKREGLLLGFPAEIEPSFRKYYFEKSLRQTRLAILIGAILIALFGVDDLTMEPDSMKIALSIRFLGVIPFLILLFAASFYPVYERYFQPILCVSTVIVGISLIALISLHSVPTVYYHFPSLMLLVVAAYTLYRVRFVYATISQVSISLIALGAARWGFGIPQDIFVLEAMRFLAVNANGMLACYFLERHLRNEFLESRIIALKKKHADEANKIKDNFVSHVAHDLRTPITSIIGLLKLLNSKGEEPSADKRKEVSRRVLNISEAMLGETDKLLGITMLRSGNLKPKLSRIKAAQLADEVVTRTRNIAGSKGIAMKNDIPTDTEVVADRYLFGEVLLNLVANSVKFCKEGDTIIFNASRGARTVITVRDTGVGIDPSIIGDIFKADVLTVRPGTSGEKGIGLGLPLCMNILLAHGGSMRAESAPGKGAAFHIELPGTPTP